MTAALNQHSSTIQEDDQVSSKSTSASTTSRSSKPAPPPPLVSSLARSKARSSSINSISSVSSISSITSLSPPTTAVATTTATTATAAAIMSMSMSSATVLSSTTSTSPKSTSPKSTSPKSTSPKSGPSSSSPSPTSSGGFFNPVSSGPSPSTSYFPSFPIRNKSRTPSVSSTSTITQPVHNLLQTSSGILLPKRQATTSSSAAPALSTHSTASSSSLALPSPTLSASTSSSSLDQTYKNNASNHMNGPTSSTTPTIDMSQHTNTNGRASSNPILVLEPLNDTFALKSLDLPEHTKVKIGRQTGVTTAPIPSNGYFDSKVLSRVHAEVWSENSKVFIRDLKSSNGTFLNGKRLCPENVESEPFILNQGDNLEFGIDILDENGALLHEKVACKIYISRMSYPTPGGSPQEAHAKLKSGSPSGSGSNSFKSNSGSNSGSGLSANIDLIISRLQNELTRSQETNGDLGALKQGLGELEKAFVVTGKDSKSKTDNTHVDTSAQVATALAASAAEHEKKLEETQQAHSAQVLQLTTTLKETKAELAAYVQKTQLLEPLVAEDEILRAKFAQTTADLNKAKAERDSAKDGMNKLINEHQQAIETLRKEQEAALARLEEAHKTTLEQIARETALAQDVMSLKHQQELAQVAEVLSKQEIQTTSTAALESEIATLKTQVQSLQETAHDQGKLVQELKSEKAELHKKVEDTIAELSRTTLELEAQREKNTSEDLSSLTPTSPTSPSTASITTTKTTSSSSSSQDGSVSKNEFSWSQFVFPMAKKNPSHPHQPPTIFLSGGFMLVGLGAYVLWHKAGLVSN